MADSADVKVVAAAPPYAQTQAVAGFAGMATAPPDAQTHAVMQSHALKHRFNVQNCIKPQIQAATVSDW